MNRFSLPEQTCQALYQHCHATAARTAGDTFARILDLCERYDWPNAAEHQAWLQSATAVEIAEWAAPILADEDAATAAAAEE